MNGSAGGSSVHAHVDVMRNGSHDARGGVGAQRGSFGRLIGTRRASKDPFSTATTAPAATTTTTTAASKSFTTSTTRLPTIARGGGGITHTSVSISSSSQLTNYTSSGSAPALPFRLGEGGVSTTTATSTRAPPFIITERTPRAELLAIVSQLQADLVQRTDSVNAIQRNFQRLSAMHYAEQEELQRLRQLRQDQQDAFHREENAELITQVQLVEQLRAELGERAEANTRLQAEGAAAREEQQRAARVYDLEVTCSEEYHCIALAEASAYAELVKSASAQHARLSWHEKTKGELHQRQSGLLRVMRAHTARLDALAQEAKEAARGQGAAAHLSPVVKSDASPPRSEEEQMLVAELEKAEEAVKICVTAYKTAATQRDSAAIAAGQQQLADARSKLLDVHHAFATSLESCEAEERCTLASAAADTVEDLIGSFQLTRAALEGNARLVAETALHLNDTRMQCNARLDQWTVSADARLCEFQRNVDAWCAAVHRDFTSQRELLEQQGREAHDLAAARAEWTALRDTERKAHRAELAHARQATASKVAAVESRLTASQQRCAALQKSLEEAQAALQQAVAEVEHRLQTRAAELAVEREALLSRQWFRVQTAQEQYNAALVELLWTVLSAREACSKEEDDERRILYREYVQTTAPRTLQSSIGAKTAAGVTQAVWSARVAHVAELEAAARLLVREKAEASFAQLTSTEVSEREHLQEQCHVAQLHQEVVEARAGAAEAAARYERQQSQLQAGLLQAQEERRAAAAKAADAVAAAQMAREAEQATREQLRFFQAATKAAAQRVEAAESATESACCCPLCLQVLYNPVACVPCGHVYCAGCLLWHGRNNLLSSLTSAEGVKAHSRRVSAVAAARAEVDVAHWMAAQLEPQAPLYCPECGTQSVSTLVELRSLGELAAKYSYKKSALLELLKDLS